ncbi:MAG: hypothetical protein HXY40_03125 [Chloroflexi bacterium]|nr:hypothetical protein [Chloroflexota bacterium]
MPQTQQHPLVAQIAALVEQRTGLAVNQQFRHELEPLLRGLANGNLDAYLRQLRENGETTPVWQRLLYTLTIGETYFFRDPAHFRLLREHILPALVLKRRAQPHPELNIWSAGCASGEEAYSLAITLYEFLPDLARWTLRLVATDINATAVQAAQRGLYRAWSFRHTEPSLRARHFSEQGGSWQIKAPLQTLVTFRHANLFAEPPLQQFDIIFCRNVLIYLQDTHTQTLEDKFYRALAPGGWLFLGQAEAIHSRRDRWRPHVFPGTVVYQKPETKTGKLALIERHNNPPLDLRPAPPQPPPATYRDAVLAMHADEGAKAERLLAELLTQNPQHAAAHTLLALIFANRRALPEAHAHLDHALRLDPMLADAHYLRGMLLMEEGQKGEAERTLQGALYCRPTHVLSLFMLGNLQAQQGELKRAYRTWEKARALVKGLPPDEPVSDLSDLTAAGLEALIGHRVGDEKPK